MNLDFNEFGRWLSVVSSTTGDQSMRKDMPESEGHWGLNMIADRGNEQYFELYARKSNEMLFDIHDQLIRERCANGCDIEVKVVFKDDRVMDLQVISEHGIQTITTAGGGQTRTATFPIRDTFKNKVSGADFSVKTTDGTDVTVLMTRINILKKTHRKISLPWLMFLLDE